MPQKRAPGQKQVIVMVRESFLSEIDDSVCKLGFSDRASLIRAAVYEKLDRELKGKLPIEISTAPSRAGKGGRPKTKKIKKETASVKDPDFKMVAEPSAPYGKKKK